MRSGGTGEPPQGEVRKYKAAQVSEGKRGCNCRGIEAFSDDLIFAFLLRLVMFKYIPADFIIYR